MKRKVRSMLELVCMYVCVLSVCVCVCVCVCVPPTPVSLPHMFSCFCVFIFCVCVCVVGWLHIVHDNYRLWLRSYTGSSVGSLCGLEKGAGSFALPSTEHSAITVIFTRPKDV